jgi:immune inhibitor A
MAGFDMSLPTGGLLIWHIDEAQQTNTDENHYKVALMQADGRRDLERSANRGDPGDAYPGTSNNRAFNATSRPNSKSYSNAASCVAVTGISASGPSMTMQIQVQCPPGQRAPSQAAAMATAAAMAPGPAAAKAKSAAKPKRSAAKPKRPAAKRRPAKRPRAAAKRSVRKARR